MTCDEHLTEAGVALVDLEHHLEAAAVVAERNKTPAPHIDRRQLMMGLLPRLMNLIIDWKRMIKESERT